MTQVTGVQSQGVLYERLKMVLDTSLLTTQYYKVLSRVKWSNPVKSGATSSTPECRIYWKGSLWVSLDYGQLTILVGSLIYLFISLFISTYLSIVIIILSCQQHGYPWPSVATSPYRSSLPAGLQGNPPVSTQSCYM